jgi:dephospho-CoA kinase
MILLGLTGSIAMGKSATAAMFFAAGCAVHDADAAVHVAYSGIAVPWFEANFPHVVLNKSVSRETLSKHLREFPDDLKRIEAYIHPLLSQDRLDKTQKARDQGMRVMVYDMPILFETGMHNRVDLIVTVSCHAALQQQRALSRPNMTQEKLDFILARQWTDAKKRMNSHAIITTDVDLSTTQRQVSDLLRSMA